MTYDGDGSGGTVRFYRIAYDVDCTMRKIREIAELPDYLADRLAQGR